MKATESTTCLTYSMASAQDPLEVSPSPQAPSVTNLTFVVSCPLATGECTVRQIEIALPVGTADGGDPTDLTVVAPPLSAVSASSSDELEVWTVTAGVAPGSFVFTPRSGTVLISSQSLAFYITGVQVSMLVGTAEVKIFEWASPGDGTPPTPPLQLPSGMATIPVSKFPAGFFLFDFEPSSPQVNSGATVTLTWAGSTNAVYTMVYSNDEDPLDVTNVRGWASPPLYAATTFALTASATVVNQTVSRKLTTTVTVASPEVVSFYPTPNSIDYDETVTLTWRAIHADGVYLLTGQTGRKKLPPVSDPGNPQTLQPQYGASYSLQAFKMQGGSEVVSAAVPLSFTFNPIVWTAFSADPMVVDLQTPTTTLAWEVGHAVAVYLNGAPVDRQDSTVMSPTAPTPYALSATWIDGTTQQGPAIMVGTVQVSSVSHTTDFDLNRGQVTITFSAQNATGVTVTDGFLFVYGMGINQRFRMQLASVTRIDNTTWQVVLYMVVNPVVFMIPNVGIEYDWVVDGFVPVGVNGQIDMLRGGP